MQQIPRLSIFNYEIKTISYTSNENFFAFTIYSDRVSVSVLTITGTECKLVELGRVASQTGGQVGIHVQLCVTAVTLGS